MLDVLGVTECLLQQLQDTPGGRPRASEDLLLALQALFPAQLEPALELLDQRAVCRLTAPAGRSVFRVLGSSGVAYYCLQTLTHCTCPAFQYSVIHRGDQLFCKHLLAARIATALGHCEQSTVSDLGLKEILTEIQ